MQQIYSNEKMKLFNGINSWKPARYWLEKSFMVNARYCFRFQNCYEDQKISNLGLFFDSLIVSNDFFTWSYNDKNVMTHCRLVFFSFSLKLQLRPSLERRRSFANGWSTSARKFWRQSSETRNQFHSGNRSMPSHSGSTRSIFRFRLPSIWYSFAFILNGFFTVTLLYQILICIWVFRNKRCKCSIQS